METIQEPPRRVPVVAEVDVCVIGGSCTGVFAAVAAARLGARVALIENNGFFGGVATAGLVCVWHTLLDTRFDRQVIAGLTAEALERLDRRGGLNSLTPTVHKSFVFSPAELMLVLDELVVESGVRPFLHTRLVAAAVEGDRVTAAIVEDKSGRRAVRARCFVDASGDGDLIARAALPCRIAAGADLQPPTTCAMVRGLKALAERNPGFDLGRAMFDPKLPQALKKGFMWSVETAGGGDEQMIAGTRVSAANCADADELTAAEIEGRRQVRSLLDLLRGNFVGGRELIRLSGLPACIGVRETRHADCLHRLTEQELLNGVRFPDAIANGTYRVDVHHSDRPGLTFRYLDGREVYIDADGARLEGRWRAPGGADPTFYQVPFRSLVPAGPIGNVLAAGRLIDADRGAYGAIRVMVNCNQTGQAAGVGAALAVRTGCPPARVDAAALRKLLAEQGAAIV